MRLTFVIALLGALASGQSLVEHAAAAAGGSVGGVAGKKVSDGLTSIFQKVDKQTQKAAKGPTGAAPTSTEPLLEVGPGVPKQRASVPPPPPPLKHASAPRPAPLPVARVVAPPPVVPQLEPEPNPVTASELKSVNAGMTRGDVLKLGPPAARITMFDEGHLIEIFRYQDHDLSLGVVRLTDGSVSSVQVR